MKSVDFEAWICGFASWNQQIFVKSMDFNEIRMFAVDSNINPLKNTQNFQILVLQEDGIGTHTGNVN